MVNARVLLHRPLIPKFDSAVTQESYQDDRSITMSPSQQRWDRPKYNDEWDMCDGGYDRDHDDAMKNNNIGIHGVFGITYTSSSK